MIGLPTETDDDLVAIRDLTLQMRERMLKHARATRPDRPDRRQREPADSQAGHRLSVAADGGSGASIDRKIKRLRTLTAGIDNVYFNIKSERHSYYQALLSLGDRRVAPAIEARRAQRPELARGRRRRRRRRRLLHLPRPQPRRRAAVGHHRRRHEGGVLPGRVRQERCARNGRCRRSARRRTPGCCRSSSTDVGLAAASVDQRVQEAIGAPVLVLLKRLENQLADAVLRRACRRSAAAARSCGARR